MNITYVSACMDASGYAEAARNHIAALDTAGVKINVVPISFEGYRSDLGRLGAMVQGMIGKNPPGNIQIIHATPQNYPRLKNPAKYNIGYCAWETDLLPAGWAELINCMNEVWVPSKHNATVMKDSGVVIPIRVMPHPFRIVEPEGETTGVVANVDKNDFVFYSIFQWIERKNPVDLLRAYMTEFKSNEKVAMVLKTYVVNPSNQSEAQRIRDRIRDIKKKMYLKEYPKILLISSLLSKNQIRTLHTQCDCYVSLHRCEGFGIPFAEAMLAKNPVIATEYGGPADFMKTQMCVKYQMTPVYGMPWSIYTGDMKWAQPDIMHARELMRWAYENQKAAKEMGARGYEDLLATHSWEVMGKRMKARLEEIQKEL